MVISVRHNLPGGGASCVRAAPSSMLARRASFTAVTVRVTVAGATFRLAKGESIRTEYPELQEASIGELLSAIENVDDVVRYVADRALRVLAALVDRPHHLRVLRLV